ncbi:3-keto-5-aminohexanoate cleavage protein [bacterium]|nr:3-keto-5-aminohexanoate cleavage protein [bacterium]
MYKTVITCAVSGAETTREDNPNLPLTPQEIADAAYEANQAGAAIVHLHVRDAEGQPTQDVKVFEETIGLIRKKCNMVIEVTTGGAVGMTLEERLQPLQLEPEMASLDCGTANFGDDYIINTLPMIREAGQIMKKKKIQPTLECFDLSHVDTSINLIREGLIEPPFHYGFVLNVPGCIRYDAETLGIFARRVPKGSYWTVMGIGGKANLSAIYGAITYQGFIRVGFEDNIYFGKGVLAESNAQLVERAARIATDAGCTIATADEVRSLLKLR